MGVVNDYTVAGQIRGEADASGVRTSYLPDALGSVTAAYRNGTLSTTTYTPYGRGNPPAGATMGWVGAYGYRPLSLPLVTSYVPKRHFSNTGRWNSYDSLWPYAAAYTYADCAPVNKIDPSGALAAIPIWEPWPVYKCGGSVSYTRWINFGTGWFGLPPYKQGWIIQKITRWNQAIDCVTGSTYNWPVTTYFEAWGVSVAADGTPLLWVGDIGTGSGFRIDDNRAGDTWGTKLHGVCGSSYIDGLAYFIEGEPPNFHRYFAVGNVPPV